MARSVRPLRWGASFVVVAAAAFALTSCVADPPPIIGTATGGDGRATVSWQPPLASPQEIVAYVVTPWIGSVRQTPALIDSTATSQLMTGLTNWREYRFTVHAVNAQGGDSAESNVSNPVTPMPQIAAGGYHSCAIVSGGAVDCWGENARGWLGDGTTTNQGHPVAVSGLSGAIAIVADVNHTCVLTTDRTVACWGANSRGQLGNGTTSDSTVPVEVSGLSGVVALAAGNARTCAVVASGAIKCWGFNGNGQLGDGTTTSSSVPVSVTGISDAIEITTGDFHTCALMSSGPIKCWGSNANGELGNGNLGVTQSLTPITVNVITDATALAAGGTHTCAIVTDGEATCWGRMFNTIHDTPFLITGVTAATALAAGSGHTCAIFDDGTAGCWGDNEAGQLGNGHTSPCDPEEGCTPGGTPAGSVVGITDITGITAGTAHTCALTVGGTINCWGDNQYGQLGIGLPPPYAATTPVAVVWT